MHSVSSSVSAPTGSKKVAVPSCSPVPRIALSQQSAVVSAHVAQIATEMFGGLVWEPAPDNQVSISTDPRFPNESVLPWSLALEVASYISADDVCKGIFGISPEKRGRVVANLFIAFSVEEQAEFLAGIESQAQFNAVINCLPKELTHLNLSSSSRWVSDEIIDYCVKRWPGLRSLNISSCTRLTEDAFINIGVHCHDLEEFRANNRNGDIYRETIRVLGMGCPKLRIFEMDEIGCDNNVDDDSIGLWLADKCRFLETLDIGGAPISDDVLQEIADVRLPLQALCGNGDRTTDDGIRSLTQACPHLRIFKMGDAGGITNAALQMLANCRKLEELSLGHANIDEEGIKIICREFRQLRVLCLELDDPLSSEAQRQIRNAYPDIQLELEFE